MMPAGEIEVVADVAYFRPTGRVSLEEAIERLDQAIAFARERGLPKLCINATGLSGFPSPSLPERYFFARRFAATAQGKVQLALVLRPEILDPERFGVMVARNAGMHVEVFVTETGALAWLHPPSNPR